LPNIPILFQIFAILDLKNFYTS